MPRVEGAEAGNVVVTTPTLADGLEARHGWAGGSCGIGCSVCQSESTSENSRG
jgi:hypothetical protein